MRKRLTVKWLPVAVLLLCFMLVGLTVSVAADTATVTINWEITGGSIQEAADNYVWDPVHLKYTLIQGTGLTVLREPSVRITISNSGSQYADWSIGFVPNTDDGVEAALKNTDCSGRLGYLEENENNSGYPVRKVYSSDISIITLPQTAAADSLKIGTVIVSITHLPPEPEDEPPLDELPEEEEPEGEPEAPAEPEGEPEEPEGEPEALLEEPEESPETELPEADTPGPDGPVEETPGSELPDNGTPEAELSAEDDTIPTEVIPEEPVGEDTTDGIAPEDSVPGTEDSPADRIPTAESQTGVSSAENTDPTSMPADIPVTGDVPANTVSSDSTPTQDNTAADAPAVVTPPENAPEE